MNTGDEKVLDGGQSNRRRAHQCIKNTLRLTDADYKNWRRSMEPESRRVFKAELEKYQELTEFMHGQYKQWASRLLVEYPDVDGKDKANAHSALYSLLQERETAPKERNLAAWRYDYITRLRAAIREDEAAQYGDLLKISLPGDGYLTDIAGVQLIYVLGDLFEDHCRKYENLTSQLPEERLPEIIKLNPILAGISAESELEGRCPSAIRKGNVDSLPARLLLATALNRSAHEDKEYAWHDERAFGEMLMLVENLIFQGIERIPISLDDKKFGEWLVEVLGGKFPISLGIDWRPLQARVLGYCQQRALKIISPEDNRGSAVVRTSHPSIARRVSTLAVAWSYCANIKHDARIPGAKDVDLVSGRPEADRSVYHPSVLVHHRRQAALLISSNQYHELSLERLKTQHTANQYKMLTRPVFVERVLRGSSLDRWSTLLAEFQKTQS